MAPNNAVMCTTGQGCQIWWVNVLCLTKVLGTGAPNAAIPMVRNPPAFPPFLRLMKTRGEDIRPSISHKSTSHMFWWISAHVPSPASSGDRTAEPYQQFLRGRSQQNHMGYRWRATPWHRQATPRCLIMWYSGEPGTGLFVRSWSHAVICWTLSRCSGVNWRLFECDWQQCFLEQRVQCEAMQGLFPVCNFCILCIRILCS